MPVLRVGLCAALTQEVFNTLQDVKLHTVLDFLSNEVEEIAQKTRISYKDLVAIRRVVLAQYSAFPVNGADLYDEVLSSVAILSTGSTSIDRLLDGGFYTTEVIEVMGSASVGKTQLCLSSAVSVATYSEQNVLYIDTAGGFDANRVLEMAHQKLPKAANSAGKEEAVLCRIKCVKALDVFELLHQLEAVKETLNKQTDPFMLGVKLIVVDSVASVISPILGGLQSDGHGYMMHVARALKYIATEYSIAVLITNNVVYDNNGISKPALGRSWYHIPNIRIDLKKEQLEKNEGHQRMTKRFASLVKSGRQAIGDSVTVQITKEGVVDI